MVQENTVTRLLKLLRRQFKDEFAATSIEYALLAALIALAIIGAVSVMGGSLADSYENVLTELEAAKSRD